MDVLVMGPTGSIGRATTSVLLDAGHTLHLLCRTQPHVAMSHAQQITWHQCDRRDHEGMQRALQQIRVDAVVDLSTYNADDLEICLRVLAWRVSAYVLMSSIAVAPQLDNSPQALPVREDVFARTSGIGSYGSQKGDAERLLLANTVCMGRSIILRTAEVIGAADERERYVFARALAGRHDLLIPDDGLNAVHTTDVLDVAEAIQLLVTEPTASTGVYHVAGRSAVTLRSLVSRMMDASGLNCQLVGVPSQFIRQIFPNFYYPYAVRSTVIEANKLNSRFGFYPRHDHQASFRRSWGLFQAEHHKLAGGLADIPALSNPYVPPRSPRMLTMAQEDHLLAKWRQVLAAANSLSESTPRPENLVGMSRQEVRYV